MTVGTPETGEALLVERSPTCEIAAILTSQTPASGSGPSERDYLAGMIHVLKQLTGDLPQDARHKIISRLKALFDFFPIVHADNALKLLHVDSFIRRHRTFREKRLDGTLDGFY